MHRQIRNKLQQNSNSPRSTRKTFLAKFFYSRPDLDSIDVANDDRRHRTHTYTHTHARAHKHRMRPCRGFPRSMEGRKETRFEVVPLYADISWEEPMLQEEGRGGALHRARDERTKRGVGGRREGGRGESRRRASFRTVLEKVVAYTTFTDLHYPRFAPTLDTHHRPPQIVPLQRRVRDGRRPAGRPAAATTSSVRPTKWHLPSPSQPRPCVSFARQNYVTVARTSRPKFFYSARTWIVR